MIFQPCEMDYKGFVNFLLAVESLSDFSKEALLYFWRILDLDRSGRLSREKIKYFYKDISRCLKNIGYEAPSEESVVLEVFDLLSCNAAEGATLQDMVRA